MSYSKQALALGEQILDEFRPITEHYQTIAQHLIRWFYPKDDQHKDPSGVFHVRKYWDEKYSTRPYPPSLAKAISEIDSALASGEKFKHKTEKFLHKRAHKFELVKFVFQALFHGLTLKHSCELAAIASYKGATHCAIKASSIEKAVRSTERETPDFGRQFYFEAMAYNLTPPLKRPDLRPLFVSALRQSVEAADAILEDREHLYREACAQYEERQQQIELLENERKKLMTQLGHDYADRIIGAIR